MAKSSSGGPKSKIDLATFGGLAIAALGILGGLLLEGGKLGDVAQITAAMIVLGGTLGAVMVTTPMPALVGAVKKFRYVFFEPPISFEATIEEILGYANQARREGIVSLEQKTSGIKDPFLRKAVMLGVDGTDLHELQQIMELELSKEESQGIAESKVYEAAGGYAPTIGIIGAVLGLIQVMKHLENIEEVGAGIAVAFVATVYGVGLANIIFLPAATKLKARVDQWVKLRELMLAGVSSIVQGLHPHMIETKLQAYVVTPKKKQTKAQAAAAPASETAAA